MISQAIQDAMNEQIKNELYSAYLYLSMAAYCESINLKGFAHWMRVQHQEETGHAMRFFDFINDRGGRVTLQAIPQPPTEFKSPLDIFEQTLEHERKVTAMINKIYDLAVKEGDYASQALLQWFVTEQVEEEKSATEILEKLRLAGDRGSALLYLDHELGEREAE
jgi:ferritin